MIAECPNELVQILSEDVSFYANHVLRSVFWRRRFPDDGNRLRRLRRGGVDLDEAGGKGVLRGRREILKVRDAGRSKELLGLSRLRTGRCDYCLYARIADGFGAWVMALLLPLISRVVVPDIVLKDL